MDDAVREGEWLDLAMMSGGIGAWRWDLDRGEVLITRNAEYDRIMDIDPRSACWTAKMLFKIIHPDDVQMVREKLRAVVHGEAEAYDAVYRLCRRDGTVRWVHAHGRGVADDEGRVTRITGAIRDVTEAMNRRAERDEFVATLSHDLRSPLTTVKGNAELLQARWAQVASPEKLLHKIIANVDRADGMIQDLLDASRLEAEPRADLVSSLCDLGELLFEAAEGLSNLHGDRFRPSASGDFQGQWYCEAFRRVVENLATNAAKYGDPATPVTLRLSRTPDTVVLAVHNDGPPIPPDEQKAIFQPYHRARASLSSGKKGWGLGLAVVRHIADALGGRVELESGPENGTTFLFAFPVAAR
jgi:signal transduction histidine kinase